MNTKDYPHLNRVCKSLGVTLEAYLELLKEKTGFKFSLDELELYWKKNHKELDEFTYEK